MGAFTNRTWILFVGWVVAAIIVILNGFLVYQQIGVMIGHGGNVALWAWIVVVPVIVICTIVLAWITIAPWVRGRTSWIPKPTVLDKIEVLAPEKDPITHIGVALDNSPVDELVISRAMSLAKIHKAEITLIHVTDSPGVQVYGAQMGDEHARDDINYVDEIAEILKRQGFRAHSILRAGKPAEEIVKAVKEEKIDLLLMGSHGHRFIGDMFYGETASTVRHNIDIPTMVVKPQKPADSGK